MHKPKPIALLLTLVALLWSASLVQAKPTELPSLAMQINAIDGPMADGSYHISGSVVANGFTFESGVNYSNVLSVWAEFTDDGGFWPQHYRYWDHALSCNVQTDGVCLTAEELSGYGVTILSILEKSLADEDEGRTIDFEIDLTPPEGSTRLRIVTQLRHTYCSVVSYWDSINFIWDVYEHGQVEVITPAAPTPSGAPGGLSPAKIVQDLLATPTSADVDLTVDGQAMILQAVEGGEIVGGRDAVVVVTPKLVGQDPGGLQARVSVWVDSHLLDTRTGLIGEPLFFFCPVNYLPAGITTHHTLQVSAELVSDSVSDTNPGNNTTGINFSSHATKPFRILFSRIRMSNGSVISQGELISYAGDALAFMRQVYPLAYLSRVPATYCEYPLSDAKASVSIHLAKSMARYNSERCATNLPCNQPRADVIVGVFPEGYYGNAQGWLYGRGAQSWKSLIDWGAAGIGWLVGGGAQVSRAATTTVANPENTSHEIGHHFDLGDEYAGNNAGTTIQDVYIRKDGRTFRITAERNLQMGVGRWINFMGEAGVEAAHPTWVNANTWNTLLGQTRSGAWLISDPVASLHPMFVPVQDSFEVEGKAILVMGQIDPQGSAVIQTIDQVERYDSRPSAEGEFTLEAFDATNRSLGQIHFDTYAAEENGIRPFLVALPVTDHRAIARVEMRRGAFPLTEVRRSANPPSAALLTQPDFNAASLSLRWSLQDADGDTLRSSVFYSADNGNTWSLVAIDLKDPVLDLDPAQFAGGIAQFRISVSDGINETVLLTDPVALPNRAPSVTIQESGEMTFAANELVGVVAQVYDPEDGMLEAGNLTWVDEQGTVIGYGDLLQARLSSGVHTLTLKATDSAGAMTEASVTIGVEEPKAISSTSFTLPQGGIFYLLACLGAGLLAAAGTLGVVLVMRSMVRRQPPPAAGARLLRDQQGGWWSRAGDGQSWYWWNGQAWQPAPIPPSPGRVSAPQRSRRNARARSWIGSLVLLVVIILVVGGGVALFALGLIPGLQLNPAASVDLKDLFLTFGGGLLLMLLGTLILRGGMKAIITRRALVTDEDGMMQREVTGCSAVLQGMGQLFFGLLLTIAGIVISGLAFFQQVLPFLGIRIL